jgi:hypothetical protein
MAHFAKLDENNIVIRVHRVGNDIATSEQAGIDYLQKIHNTDATFKQTSYNTKGGVHYGQNGQPDGGVALRKNYAGKGYTYDESRDAFIAPKPYPSWTLNETTCFWEAPVAEPTDDNYYVWDETSQSWQIPE